MLLLLKTFCEILALRKGPQDVPSAWLVLFVALVLLFLSSFAAVELVGVREDHNYSLALLAYAVGLSFYMAIIFVTGHAGRMLPAISSIIACGALITLLFAAEFFLMSGLFGPQVAGLLATLILFWSVPVEGHIMAAAIGQHWFVGIVIAMIAFIIQYGLQSAIGA